jgi:hypothetical protein
MISPRSLSSRKRPRSKSPQSPPPRLKKRKIESRKESPKLDDRIYEETVTDRDYFIMKYVSWFISGPNHKRFLKGPQSVRVFPNVRGKGFILFGDYHTPLPSDTCKIVTKGRVEESEKINIVLDRIFRERLGGNRMHDFFFEYRYLKTDSDDFEEDLTWFATPEDFPIHEISRKFIRCFRVDKSACKEIFPSARFHYIDYRSAYLNVGKIVGGVDKKLKLRSFFLNSFYEINISSGEFIRSKNVDNIDSNKITIDYYDFLRLVRSIAFGGGGILRKFLSEFYDIEIHKKTNTFKKYLRDFIERAKMSSPPSDTFLFEEAYQKFIYYYYDLDPKQIGRCNCIEEYDVQYRAKMIRKVMSSPVSREVIPFAIEEANGLIQEYEEEVDRNGIFDLAVRIAKTAETSPDGKRKLVTINKRDYDKLIEARRFTSEKLINISAIYEFDIPTACRMFKSSLEAESRFVWLYAGDKHARTITNIISHIASKTPGESDYHLTKIAPGFDQKCIEMPLPY